MISKKQIALLHVGYKQLGLRREDWEALLLGNFGVAHTDELPSAQVPRALALLEEMGFRPQFQQQNRKRYQRADGAGKILAKIGRLLEELGQPWSYAEGIAKRQWKKDKLEFCTPAQLHAVLIALIQAQKKRSSTNSERAEGAATQSRGGVYPRPSSSAKPARVKIEKAAVIRPCPACGQKNRVPLARVQEAPHCGACHAELSGW